MIEKDKNLRELLKKRNVKYIRKLLVEQKDKYSCEEMIAASKELDDDKKMKVYLAVLDISESFEKLCKLLKTDVEKALLIKCMPKYPNGIYYIMERMNKNNIKNLVEKEQIKVVLKNYRWWIDIYEKFGNLFVEEMIEVDPNYKIMDLVNIISEKSLEEVCKKNFFKEGYNRLIQELEEPVKRRTYTKVFLEEKCDNAYIASKILDENDYNEEDFNKLLLIIASFGDASIIYENLNRNNLTESQRKMLEKSLLETHNIEYISYYYFYNDLKMFNFYFGSTLLFLSFVNMNITLFKNEDILANVMNIIGNQSENVKYVDSTKEKFKTSDTNNYIKVKKKDNIMDDLLIN